MEAREYTAADAGAVCEIAYEHYRREGERCPILRRVDKEAFLCDTLPRAEAARGVALCEGDRLIGYLLEGDSYAEGEFTVVSVPEWACGCAGERRADALEKLFRAFARRYAGKTRFNIKLYAHDRELLWLLTLTQFSALCEQCLCLPNGKEDQRCRLMPKSEALSRWGEIWALLSGLIEHLRQSPVYYLGEEFTEAVFKDFYMEKDTAVFVSEQSGRLIGLIETNAGGNDAITRSGRCRNIGDVYVLPEHRGQGIARTLFESASHYEKARGAELLWVEHGTANPEARRFWDRYMQPYVYLMTRDVTIPAGR